MVSSGRPQSLAGMDGMGMEMRDADKCRALLSQARQRTEPAWMHTSTRCCWRHDNENEHEHEHDAGRARPQSVLRVAAGECAGA
jgi:hypothetical protein